MAELTFVRLGPDDYARAKKVLNRAKHPGFVGRDSYGRFASRGECWLAVAGDVDVGVAMVDSTKKLQALSVVTAAQGSGVGGALMQHCRPAWVNAIMDRVPWFERRGYVSVGAPKVGKSGKMATQLMQLTGDATTTQAGGPVDVTLQPTPEAEPEAEPEADQKVRLRAEVTGMLSQIRSLAALVEREPHDPERLRSLLENVDLASTMALCNVRTYMTKRGPQVRHEPLIQSFLKAQELGARVLGLTGPDALVFSVPSEERLAEARRVLQATGWRQLTETTGESDDE